MERYTLEHYTSLYEIRHQLNIVGIHLVLDEIEKYRIQFRHYFIYQTQKCYIDITPSIEEKMNRLFPFSEPYILHPLIQIFILRNDKTSCQACISRYGLFAEYLESFDLIYSFEEDITHSFNEWLEHLCGSREMKMLHLSRKIQALSLKQQQFYTKHSNHYFDLYDYMKEMELGYESARLELNSLVHQGIYQKHKVGKRHVFMGGL